MQQTLSHCSTQKLSLTQNARWLEYGRDSSKRGMTGLRVCGVAGHRLTSGHEQSRLTLQIRIGS